LNKLSLHTRIQEDDPLKNDLDVPFRRYFLPQDEDQEDVQNNITAFCQGPDRSLWIGTGMYRMDRFDPVREDFTKFNLDESISESTMLERSLSNVIYVFDILSDDNGIIWVADMFRSRLIKISPRLKKFISYMHDPGDNNSLSHSTPSSVIEDQNGNLWVSTVNGLDRIDRSKNIYTHFRPTESGQKPQPSTDMLICNIVQDPEDPDIIWVGASDGLLHKFDTKKERYTHFDLNPGNPAMRPWMDLTHESGPFLWAACWGGGLVKFNTQLETWEIFRNFEGDTTSGQTGLMFTYFDSFGEMWVGSFKGLYRKIRDSDPMEFVQYLHDPDDPGSISDDFIMYMLEDSSGILWICTLQGD